MKVEVARIDALPLGTGIKLTVGQDRIAMFRVEDEVYAIGDRCSHAEASLAEGQVYGTEVECPRHGSEFDMETGEPLQLPATKPVPTYRVLVEDEKVFLVLEES